MDNAEKVLKNFLLSNLFREATGEELSGSSTSSKNSDEFFSSSWF
jgi:hypothetical protein